MLSQKLNMPNDTNLSENLAPSSKPIIGLDPYSESSRAGRTPISQPVLPLSQVHGYTPGLDTTQSPLQPRLIRSVQSDLSSDMIQRGASSTSEELGPVSSSPTASPMTAQGIMGHDDESMPDGRKAKRELSQSKRAAQNRAAQRAFRQRKEHYIKKLEQQVRDYTEMEHSFKVIQNDNYALREYIIQLQSRLLDLQVELPQPPPNVNITPPNQNPASTATRQPHSSAPVDTGSNATSAGTLADVAAAVAGLSTAGLRAREPIAEAMYAKSTFKSENGGPPHSNDDNRRQPPPDGLPPPPSMR
ncbi:hypothetical protein F4803DRAFT_323148 [Xylaria telfairii]|nr:hypothetical protein F4803DRAFT_323148 [Xylaria telfairii]